MVVFEMLAARLRPSRKVLKNAARLAYVGENLSVGLVTELGWTLAARKEMRIVCRVCENAHYFDSSNHGLAIAGACRCPQRVKVYSYRSDEKPDVLLCSAPKKV